MRIVLATHNRDKRSELEVMLRSELGGAVAVLSLDDIPNAPTDIEETGSTLEENALIKARAVHAVCMLPTIADDTGLEVDALNGAPGVYTARFAGPKATYSENCSKLVRELQNQTNRSATFATVIAYIDTQNQEHLFRGEVEGVITESPRGTSGFGYDPVFQPIEDPLGRTFAEMSGEEKHAISHRGRATREFIEYVKALGQ